MSLWLSFFWKISGTQHVQHSRDLGWHYYLETGQPTLSSSPKWRNKEIVQWEKEKRQEELHCLHSAQSRQWESCQVEAYKWPSPIRCDATPSSTVCGECGFCQLWKLGDVAAVFRRWPWWYQWLVFRLDIMGWPGYKQFWPVSVIALTIQQQTQEIDCLYRP